MSAPHHHREDHDDEPIAYIGHRRLWGGDEPFGIHRSDRRQHLYCVGKTGTGKSTLLRNLILQDIYQGEGVGLIDPHGDLAQDIIDHIPSSRMEDVIYFNPADFKYPIGFNLLQNVPPEQRHRIASGIVSVFKAIWHESWGPRMEYILYASIAALLDCENVTILGIQRMLVDPFYRRWVVRQVKDPLVRSFWRDEFEEYDKRFMREAIAPIQNKVGQFLMSPPIRNVLGQVKRKVDPRDIMDNRKIFIANLSKGLLGEDKSNLLGSILTTSFELAAMERAKVPEQKRQDFFLFIDEFQNFSTDSFASILSEARKYRLCLTLSHQYLDQVRENVRTAVFGNVGAMISFRVGESDAEILSREFGHAFPPGQFSSLGNFEILSKVLSHGRHSEPLSGRTLRSIGVPGGQRDEVIRRSRKKYATPRAVIEKKISRWMTRHAS
jgi:hypothetical protein